MKFTLTKQVVYWSFGSQSSGLITKENMIKCLKTIEK